jgi:nicotinate-nucleotide adenylyltransferase
MVEISGEPTPGPRRVAFFGGSFDPPHLGHLAIARAAHSALALDTVLFAPVGAQPLKPLGATAPFEHRLAMTRLAISDESGFAVSTIDAPTASGEPNYTLETLLALRAKLPPESALFCLMGADSFALLKRWHRAAEIPFAAPLIVASRPGKRLEDLKPFLPEGVEIASPLETGPAPGELALRRVILRNSEDELAPLYVISGLQIEISASALRSRFRSHGAAQGNDAAAGPELLPVAVTNYIRANDLYR